MINFDDVIKEGTKENRPSWTEVPNYPYRILLIGGSRFGKTNSLLNLINQQADIDKIYLYTEVSYKAKYQFLIGKWESTCLKHFNDILKTFIEYSNDMDDIYEKNEKYDPNKK